MSSTGDVVTAAVPPRPAGAGAFVAQAFVLAMGGRVEIDETPGGGTTLVMRLPSVDPAPAVRGSSA